MIEIVTIGDELLLGQTIDTNAAFLSEQLAAAGLRVTRRTTVGDDAEAIANAVTDALARTGIVITTGGLGPTRDDLTRPIIAELYGRALVLRDDLLDKLRERWQHRGLTMPASNRSQAEVPDGARVLTNRLGSAPGLVLEDKRGLTIMLPGVPHELRDLTVREVIPYLLSPGPPLPPGPPGPRRSPGPPICYRLVRVTGMPESTLADRVDDIVDAMAPLSIAFLPGFAGVDLRITSWGLFDVDECDARFAVVEQQLRERLGAHVYAVGSEDIEVVVGRMLNEKQLTLAVAESCTGGLLGQRITAVPGASTYFVGGFITYSNDSKLDLLGVSSDTLAAHGAVAEQTAREMAAGAAARMRTSAAISITGVAGPTGGTQEKPVGLVWTAVLLNDVVKTRKFVFPGDRAEIRERAAQMGLALLYEMLVTPVSRAEDRAGASARGKSWHRT
ncbi:MAG: competence/damage-inducible protein A [Gemmatimonadota bacterium]